MGKEHNTEMVVGASAPASMGIESEQNEDEMLCDARRMKENRGRGLALVARVDVRPIQVAEICFTERIRVDEGDIEELADNIAEHGLINPITVMMKESGGYMLISGYRRLKACAMLGCDAVSAAVLTAIDAEERLRLEISENEQRKDFTVAEKVEYARKIRVVEEEKARQRMSLYARGGNPTKEGRLARATPENVGKKGRTRDEVARAVGFGSGAQLERAEYVAKHRPDLLQKVDRGEETIYGAYRTAYEEKKTQGAVKPKCEVSVEPKAEYTAPENKAAPVYIGPMNPELWEPLDAYNPGLEKNTGAGIKGASHQKLMENHIYATLYEKYIEAIKSVNVMIGSYDAARDGFETTLRGEWSNIEAVRHERDALLTENENLKMELSQQSKTSSVYLEERNELRKVLDRLQKENSLLQQELQKVKVVGGKKK